jgi:hypothetical protein
MAFGAKTLVAISAPSIPPTRTSADNLLTDIAKFNALTLIEKKAIMVLCLAAEVNATQSIGNYSPASGSKLDALMQDSNAYIGNVPTSDLLSAQAAIMWQNSASGLSSDIDTLRGQVQGLVQYSEEELDRSLLYLRLLNVF